MPSQTDKLPPQDIEAEKSLLGCLLIDSDAIIKVADFLQARDFYNNSHRKIYETTLELFERREAIDILSLTSRLKNKNVFNEIGGAGYLADLVNAVPTASHILNYAKIIQQKRILRDLISAGYEISEMACDENKDPDELVDEAERKIFSIAQGALTQQFSAVKDSLEETWARLDELSKQKGQLRGVATGFAQLDNLLAGLQKSDLIILAARPSIGKSSLAIDIARNAATQHKVPVGIFSLEMSKDQIIDRLLAAQADVDLWRLRTGRLSEEGPDNDFKRIQQAMGILAEAPIYIDDMAGTNILQMRAMARRLAARKGLGLLIIDYLQLMQHRNPNLNILQQVTENSKALKGLAKELNVPVLAVSQLSRAVEQRTPQIPRLSDLRESGCLTGDTLIIRADSGERVPIKNLVGKTNIPVHTLDNDFKIKTKYISQVFSSGVKEVFELKTRSGFSIKVSANHPFWRTDGWTRLDELKIGDKIATPEKLEISSPKNKLSDNEIILLAHLLGDGCILKNQPYHYTSADQQNIKIVAQAAKDLFNIKSKIIKQKNWWHVYLTSPYRLTHKTYHPITNWYKKLGLKRIHSWEKEIPEAVFSLSNEKIALFLKHLWATDGNISAKILKNHKTSANIYYASTSDKLTQGIKQLLLRLNIRSKISAVKKKNYRPCYHIKIQGKKHQLNFFKKIGCFGERSKNIEFLTKQIKQIIPNTNLDVWPKETWKFFIDPIRKKQGLSWRGFAKGIEMSYCGSTLFKHGISSARMEKIANFLKAPVLYNIAKSEILWDEIISITPLGKQEVFDATVPETHNFVANGIIVENSLEQDADVVAFIYREDRYKENSEKPNIAEIIVAKHRNGPVGKVELYFDETRASFRNLEKNY